MLSSFFPVGGQRHKEGVWAVQLAKLLLFVSLTTNLDSRSFY